MCVIGWRAFWKKRGKLQTLVDRLWLRRCSGPEPNDLDGACNSSANGENSTIRTDDFRLTPTMANLTLIAISDQCHATSSRDQRIPDILPETASEARKVHGNWQIESQPSALWYVLVLACVRSIKEASRPLAKRSRPQYSILSRHSVAEAEAAAQHSNHGSSQQDCPDKPVEAASK